jgi:hypothetical protein
MGILGMLLAVVWSAQAAESIIVEGANVINAPGLAILAELTLPAQSARVIVEGANVILEPELNILPDLEAPIQADWFIVETANINRQIHLQTPLSLLNDVTPPTGQEITSRAANGNIIITWITPEFADSRIDYGQQPGVYLQVATDSRYVKTHTITLTNLITDTTYYYRVSGTDLSGNTSQSAENSFMTARLIYLPVVVK